MLVRIAIACLGLAPLLQAQLVEKLNGPLAGNVSTFIWTPDGRYILYGSALSSPSIDAVTSVRVSDRSEAVYDPYPYYVGTASARFELLPDRGLVGVHYWLHDGGLEPPLYLLHVLDRATALPVTIRGALSPRFLEDGRMVYRTSIHYYMGETYERAWSGRWDVDGPTLELSPPVQPNNHVSLVLPAPRAGVAVFGWRATFDSANDAELLSVPIDGGMPTPLTPPPSGGQRDSVNVHHVRSSDELVIYTSDEGTDSAGLWAVPVDGTVPPRRLNPPLVPGRSVTGVEISPDEERVVFVSDVGAYGEYELWSTEIDGGASVRLSAPMISGGDVEDFWIGPDAARVVYRADQRADEVFELFSAPIDGHAPAMLLHPALQASDDALEAVHFTPDGRFVVFAIRMARGIVLLAAPADGSASPRVLNWPFPQGGGVWDAWDISSTVAIAPGGRHVFFLGEQDTDGVVELYSVPLGGRATPLKWSAPLVAGGDVLAFALSPSPGAVLYRADQEVDGHFELYLSALPDAPPPHASSGAPTRGGSATVPD